ncbi:MAG TPA: sugar ABC transporter substrate-binding protein [Hypericibacter adhaerens]|uniref:Sugar ABC transporter substrate-binding protein n=1 Tax=Hypericibacter adhaerens TaxID=2602016 RepID=A0A5J6N1K9_9PROT|nr:sugar ABC transporter substrate-binding protein [Hypericibacter adhaerens]QEX22893.1 sugar ABC transporter substrate-binding protein [Hypericibacter adhaerens]HWA43137.1 sugar ABC transporter substrate-binding protein [Hypericibacter adhaerens]
MKLKRMLAAIALVLLGALAVNTVATAADDVGTQDPGAKPYAEALKGKRVVLIPMAMGFDLAQGWAAYLKHEVENWGGVFETRDPNWDVNAHAQAITDVISGAQKPDVLVIHSPDLNSFSKLLKKAQKEGIYVVLIDNPMNFPADAFVGSNWYHLGELEAEAAVKACEGKSKQIGLVQGDAANASSIYQYNGIMNVLKQHPDFKVVAEPFSNWDPTTSRNVTTTMLQQNPDICAVIDFWDGDATGASAAIKDAGKTDQVALVTTGGGETVDCKALEDGTFYAVVMTELAGQSRDMNAIIKFLLQSGVKPGTSTTYIYTLEKATTKADLKPTSCWDLKSLQAGAF